MADSEVTTAQLVDILTTHKVGKSDRDCDEGCCWQHYCTCGALIYPTLEDHLASILLASFELVPKGQLHQQTAEQACSASGDLREQEKPQGDSASVPLDRIAQAIVASMEEQCSFEHVGLIGAHVDWKRVSAAAAASLELHQEWFIPTHRSTDGQHRGSLFFATEEKATSYRDEWLPNGEIVSRLVGPWRPEEKQ